MCGIAGYFNTDQAPASPDVISAMVASLRHRGPDGEEVACFGAAALGHARLAIIDLAGGKQPLSNEDGTIWITFNGEIYNYRELREELEGRGHHFRTHADTETIVHAYEEWSDRCVERFRGMFAFGILDLNTREIFLARDQLGIKPLYYLETAHRVAFASELQALLPVADEPLTLHLPAIDQYLWLQYIPAPDTVYTQIKKLPPAHRLRISLDGKVHAPEEYWRLAFAPVENRAEGEWLEALDAVLRDTVKAHLVADVPFGAFLSGGVDSSSVVAYMAELLDQPVRTFTIGFEEDAFSEVPYAEQIAQRYGTDHHVEIVKPDALAVLPQLVRHYGEPFGDSSAIPTYYVCQLARQSVPMVLSGDGGDELFAGYGTYRAWMSAQLPSAKPLWKRLALPLARALMPSRFPIRKPGVSLENWLQQIQYTSPHDRRRLWRPEYAGVCPAPLPVFTAEFARTADFALCSKVQYLDLKTYLPFDILTKVDIASMAHGLEVRTPLVDIRVAEFAATIPPSLNMTHDRAGKWEGKLLLKKLMAPRFPDGFLSRPKMGFAVPVARWFAPGGALHGYLREELLGQHAILHQYFDPAVIARMIEQNASGPLWTLLFLEEWLRQSTAEAAMCVGGRGR